MAEPPPDHSRSPPKPIEATIRTQRRKFAVEPIEMSSKSSRQSKTGRAESMAEDDTNSPRAEKSPAKRLKPEPVDMTARSSRRKPADDVPKQGQSSSTATRQDESGSPTMAESEGGAGRAAPGPAQKFKPEPVEMTRRRRKPAPAAADDGIDDAMPNPGDSKGIFKPDQPSARKKFTPQLLETSKRSRKRGEVGPAMKAGDTTEISGGDSDAIVRASPRRPGPMVLPGAPENTPNTSTNDIPLAKRKPPPPAARKHSWMPPALSRIDSSESEPEDKVPSLSTSPSASSTDAISANTTTLHGPPASASNVPGYLLSMAAQAASKQLRDQAMAAFPNDDHHEPVHHFGLDSDETSDDSEGSEEQIHRYDPGRRESDAGIIWQLIEIQRHHSSISESAKPHQPPNLSAAPQPPHRLIGGPSSADPYSRALAQQRKHASPPMLGRDLVFPRMLSPQATKLEMDQYPTMETRPGHQPRADGKGLWMGFCAIGTNPGAPSHRGLKGLETPLPGAGSAPSAEDIDAKLSKLRRDTSPHPTPSASTHPPSTSDHFGETPPVSSRNKPTSNSLLNILSSSPKSKPKPLADDAFVTQVFNYLSLGYPALARKFDAELSKISGLTVAELCVHDPPLQPPGPSARGNAEPGPLGFVGLETTKPLAEVGRWKALKLYIEEWERQARGTGVAEDPGGKGLDAWGVRARRGSWAL
ncbi:MAG: hypothetical protein M1814_002580 [Vezdaea aestivalis]|nr:MAG: hypothetical protein M1814_002580 [Vezdaea aestivalis]